MCLLGFTTGSALGADTPTRVQATQQLAKLLSGHAAHSAPAAGSRQVAFLRDRRPITGEQTTLPVIGHMTAPDATVWLKVMLPGRPDGSTGWIAKAGTRELFTGWRLLVDLGT
ncbi:MAG TPA: hypothetical protein VN845_10275, partial [Solirubrobacteraceae bacterium]|nr:hypothetical protein [Solirubrobacteraceae bacterium]